jgi:hypothetical protein
MRLDNVVTQQRAVIAGHRGDDFQVSHVNPQFIPACLGLRLYRETLWLSAEPFYF